MPIPFCYLLLREGMMELQHLIHRLSDLKTTINRTLLHLQSNNDYNDEIILDLLQKIGEIAPDWFAFISETQIGSREDILTILGDMEYAMRQKDFVIMFDTLNSGLLILVEQFCDVMGEMKNE